MMRYDSRAVMNLRRNIGYCLWLHNRGITFEQIGETFGVSAHFARDAVIAHARVTGSHYQARRGRHDA